MTTYFATGASGGAQAALAALEALLDGGTLKIYTDSSTDPDNAPSGTLLATFTFSADSLGSYSVSGTYPNKTVDADASFVSDTVTAAADGTAASFTIADSSSNIICKGSVGTSGEDINFNSVSFSSGADVTLSSFSVSQPE